MLKDLLQDDDKTFAKKAKEMMQQMENQSNPDQGSTSSTSFQSILLRPKL
jgi:hypothetical protein